MGTILKNLAFTLLFYTLLVSANKEKRIIIVGSGSSGIAAATKLIANGYKNIKILEADERYGGRIHTLPFGDNVVDMGAHTCHGEEGNVVYDLVKDLGLLQTLSIAFDDIPYRNSNGSFVDSDHFKKLLELGVSIFDNEEGLTSQYNGSFGNYCMEKYSEAIKHEPYKSMDEDLLWDFTKLMESFECILDAAESWYDISSRSYNKYVEFEGDLALQWKDKGYGTILDVLQNKIPASNPNKIEITDYILFKKEVKKIDYSNLNGPIKISCVDDSVYDADFVIVTVSLGVLKERHLNMFEPYLPKKKIKSIEGLGFGGLGVVNLEFEKAFWPTGWKGYSLRWLPNELRQIREIADMEWAEDITYIYPIDFQSKSLIAWVSGPYLKDMELLSEEEVGAHVAKVMKMFLPEFDIPDKPLRTLRSNWLSHPYFYGSLSHYSLKSDALKASNADLAEPIKDSNDVPRLLFAGEATNSNHFGSVHGAIETGWREADRLIQILNN